MADVPVSGIEQDVEVAAAVDRGDAQCDSTPLLQPRVGDMPGESGSDDADAVTVQQIGQLGVGQERSDVSDRNLSTSAVEQYN